MRGVWAARRDPRPRERDPPRPPPPPPPPHRRSELAVESPCLAGRPRSPPPPPPPPPPLLEAHQRITLCEANPTYPHRRNLPSAPPPPEGVNTAVLGITEMIAATYEKREGIDDCHHRDLLWLLFGPPQYQRLAAL